MSLNIKHGRSLMKGLRVDLLPALPGGPRFPVLHNLNRNIFAAKPLLKGLQTLLALRRPEQTRQMRHPRRHMEIIDARLLSAQERSSSRVTEFGGESLEVEDGESVPSGLRCFVELGLSGLVGGVGVEGEEPARAGEFAGVEGFEGFGFGGGRVFGDTGMAYL